MARQRGLRELAAPLMNELREVSRQRVHLAVLDGAEVLYLEILSGPAGPKLPSRVGGRMPAHATGVGKAMLAHAPRTTVDTVLAAGLPRLTARTIVAPGMLHADLRRIAGRGVAFDGEESAVGLMCAANPVLDADGMAVAALSVSGRSGRMPMPRLVPAIGAVAVRSARSRK
ncbi:IclR family transcriptional regulator [Pseudonocardia sp. GCM10023141]|uniref:IclR family transcriptional regulator n=1 Tax=Pseudonocardia sp. GCM10023141 TaxID=3252653 RepID=UPI0036103A43